jgi:hypothetical protein
LGGVQVWLRGSVGFGGELVLGYLQLKQITGNMPVLIWMAVWRLNIGGQPDGGGLGKLTFGSALISLAPRVPKIGAQASIVHMKFKPGANG